MKIFAFFLIAFYCTLPGGVEGQAGYSLGFEISGLPDSVCYLVNYYGDKTYISDTAVVQDGGKLFFAGDSALAGGIYILAGQNNNRLLEFIADKDQHFTIKAEFNDLPSIVSAEGSEENRFFFGYIDYNTERMMELERMKKMKSATSHSDSSAWLQKTMDSINQLVGNYKNDFIAGHPGSFMSVIFRAMKEPDIEAAKASGSPYRYLADHYWDNFDLTDDRLLRTPLYHRKLSTFFNNVVFQHPDSIVAEADRLIEKLRSNREMFKYTVWFLTFKYETSNIMGFDEIFVHMAEKYYGRGEAFWADSSVVAAMVKRAGQLRPVLLGSVAPELILIDTSGSFISLHQTKGEYTLVLFYETDCGHCKTEIDKIKEWHTSDTTGLVVFAVCTDTSLSVWKKFIEEKNLDWIHVNGTRSITQDYHDLYNISMTPTIFLLDRQKKIIAKRLKTDQLRPFLEDFHEKRQINPE
ncbi:MAG: DUF5106 domain-containing protein [Bacteroidales bacterium]|nr:DUF5106 domain-containing protein [Bacteroidales bacterium]